MNEKARSVEQQDQAIYAEQAWEMTRWFPQFLHGETDALPEELPKYTVARLRHHFGDNYREGLRMVCDEIPMLPLELQPDVAAYLCGFPSDDLDSLLMSDADTVLRTLSEAFPPIAKPRAAESLGRSAVHIDVYLDEVERTSHRQLNDMRKRSHQHRMSAPVQEGGAFSWMDDALCAQVDPELFYPEVGRSARNAKEVCRECPVVDKCLAWALDNPDVSGVAGGMTDLERRKLRRSA